MSTFVIAALAATALCYFVDRMTRSGANAYLGIVREALIVAVLAGGFVASAVTFGRWGVLALLVILVLAVVARTFVFTAGRHS